MDQPNQTPPVQQPAPAKSAGPIVGIIIIIVVLIIGALYFYGAQLNHQPAPEINTNVSAS